MKSLSFRILNSVDQASPWVIKEVEKMETLLKEAHSSLSVCTIDERNISYGPAYSLAVEDRARVLIKIRRQFYTTEDKQ
jgi:hypothetical protein